MTASAGKSGRVYGAQATIAKPQPAAHGNSRKATALLARPLPGKAFAPGASHRRQRMARRARGCCRRRFENYFRANGKAIAKMGLSR
jgi:hypothetical protein